MNVSQLQTTLTELARVFAAAGAAKQDRELREFAETLGGFSGLTLAQFVKLAEQGRKPPPAPKPPRQPKVPKADPTVIAAEVREIYFHPGDPSVTDERIRETSERLKSLAKAALDQIAGEIDLPGMKSKRKKDDVVSAIRNQLLDRRGTAARRAMADRPPEPASGQFAPR